MLSRRSTRVLSTHSKVSFFKMELLVKDYEESIASVEVLFEKFTEAMLAHVVDPVLSYKETLEKALDKSSTSLLAIKELCTQSDEYDFDEEHQTKADLLSQRGLELLTDIGKRISLFEKQASRKLSHLRHSFHKHELKKIALDYEQKLNDLAIRKEKALIEVKQRFRCKSDNLERVAEINPSTTTNKNDAADLNKDSDKLVDQSDDLKEVVKPSSKCKYTPVSINNSQEEVKQKQVSHVPRDNYNSQCSRQLNDNNNTSAFKDDPHHSYLDVGATSFSSNHVSCAFSYSVVLVPSNSAVCFSALVQEESSPCDISEQLKQEFTHSVKEKGIEQSNLNDAQCVERYSACRDNLFESKHAEEVPSSDLKVIDTVCVRSVHDVFPPRKSDKCVVSHSSVKLQVMSLNDLLLEPPDLITSQVDMLLRFRSEKVALSWYLKLMIYNFLVSLGFRDYICFLWFHCTHRSYRFAQSMFVLYM